MTFNVNNVFQFIGEHGIVIGFLAILGLVSIISAMGQRVFEALKYFFILFIAIPAILILGLIKKSERKERLKELGEIRAFAKEHPDRARRALYYVLFSILIILILVAIVFFVQIAPLLLELDSEPFKNMTINLTNTTNP